MRILWLLVLVSACDQPFIARPDAPTPDDTVNLTAFGFSMAINPGLANDVVGRIDDSTIRASTQIGDDVTALVATFSTGGGVTVGGVPQLSGVSIQDFTQPVQYTVTGKSGATKDYVVSVHSPSASPAVAFRTGMQPSGIAIVDLDGDHKADLVTANFADQMVSVLVNTTTPGGALSFQPKQDFPAGLGPIAVVSADFDGDGRPDLAVADAVGGMLLIYVEENAPGFQLVPSGMYPTGPDPHGVAVGDFNGDGVPDLVTANYGDNTVSVFLNVTGGGAHPIFAPAATFLTGLNPESVAVVDLDGDGKLDLVVACAGSNIVSVLMGTTPVNAIHPTFAHVVDFPVELGPTSVAVGDLDGDGRPDIAVADFGSPQLVSVLMNTTTIHEPSFVPHVNLMATAPVHALAMGDLSGDGAPDLAIADSSMGISLLFDATPAASAPSFSPRADLTTDTGPWAIAIGDVDGDGTPDVVTANQTVGTVSVVLVH